MAAWYPWHNTEERCCSLSIPLPAAALPPQYEELENIYADFKDRGMEILDFPCNQFGNQAPGTDEEIQSFCTMKYHTTFPRFAKADVNGADALPLFQWLSNNTKFEGFDKNPMGLLLGQMLKKQDPEFKTSNAIKWNFTKFLIDREGNIAARFEPMTSLKKVKEKIQTLL